MSEPKITKELLESSVCQAMSTLINELKKEQCPGSWYYAWQSNIAMTIYDNSELDAEKCNDIAVKFLDRLIGDSEF